MVQKMRFAPGVLLFTALLLAGCQTEQQPPATGSAEVAPPPDPPALVTVNVIRRSAVSPRFRALGNIRPRHVSVVASGAQGIVQEFLVEAGDFIASGALLSQLRMKASSLEIEVQQALIREREAELAELQHPRAEDVSESRAQLEAQKSILTRVRRDRDKKLELDAQGAAAATEVRDAEDDYQTAVQHLNAAQAAFDRVAAGAREEQVLQAQARLESQRKHVEYLQAEQDKRSTFAPFAGFVVEEHTYVGQWLAKGDPIVTLASLDEVEVELMIDQQYVSEITPGRDVQLTVRGAASSASSEQWQGQVSTLIPRSEWESGSRSFPVIVRISNRIDDSVSPPLPALREGMMAEAEFAGVAVDAILVPKDSIVRSSRGAFVYVLNPPADGGIQNVRQVMVQTGVAVDGWIQVTGEGLAAGQQVVVEGAERLRPFKSVTIVSAAAADAADGSAADNSESAEQAGSTAAAGE
jgi:RND family efflux transporter MFP subunit